MAAMDVRQVLQLEDLVLVRGEKVSSFSEQIVDDFLAPMFFTDRDLTKNKVNLHAKELMLMRLLWYSFKNAISEGDGPALMSFWKVLTVMFRLTGHTK